MQAAASHCPSCGAPQGSRGPGSCEFCGAPTLPLGSPDPRNAIRCQGCLTLVAETDRFCSACGAAVGEAEAPLGDSELACPGCASQLEVWSLDPQLQADESVYRGVDARIHGCRSCGGAWIDRATLAAVLAEAEARAPKHVDPRSVPKRAMAAGAEIVYRKCARCRQLMNRRNFAWVSGIIVDECPSCGTYFDAGELEGVIAFVRAGGLALAKRDELGRSRVEHFPLATRTSEVSFNPPVSYTGELALVVGFLRWAGQWLRDVAKRGHAKLNEHLRER